MSDEQILIWRNNERKRDKYILYGETMIKTKDFSHWTAFIHSQHYDRSVMTDQSS